MRNLGFETCNGGENWGVYDADQSYMRGDLFSCAVCFGAYTRDSNSSWCVHCGGSAHVDCAVETDRRHRYVCASCARTD